MRDIINELNMMNASQRARFAKLTPKQEHFCELVAKGEWQYKAFDIAFDSKANHNSLSVQACNLMSKPKIKRRVQELKNELDS